MCLSFLSLSLTFSLPLTHFLSFSLSRARSLSLSLYRSVWNHAKQKATQKSFTPALPTRPSIFTLIPLLPPLLSPQPPSPPTLFDLISPSASLSLPPSMPPSLSLSRTTGSCRPLQQSASCRRQLAKPRDKFAQSRQSFCCPQLWASARQLWSLSLSLSIPPLPPRPPSRFPALFRFVFVSCMSEKRCTRAWSLLCVYIVCCLLVVR